MLGQALGRLFAVAEAYPDLKASTNFLELQRELTETEDRIAAGRRFYNANVRALNTRVESFPSNLVASTFGFHKEEYFEVEDEAVRTAPDRRLLLTYSVPAAGVGLCRRPRCRPCAVPEHLEPDRQQRHAPRSRSGSARCGRRRRRCCPSEVAEHRDARRPRARRR